MYNVLHICTFFLDGRNKTVSGQEWMTNFFFLLRHVYFKNNMSIKKPTLFYTQEFMHLLNDFWYPVVNDEIIGFNLILQIKVYYIFVYNFSQLNLSGLFILINQLTYHNLSVRKKNWAENLIYYQILTMDLFKFVGAQFSWFSAVSFTMHGWASLTNKKHGTSIH